MRGAFLHRRSRLPLLTNSDIAPIFHRRRGTILTSIACRGSKGLGSNEEDKDSANKPGKDRQDSKTTRLALFLQLKPLELLVAGQYCSLSKIPSQQRT
jgi:hypothetical protein